MVRNKDETKNMFLLSYPSSQSQLYSFTFSSSISSLYAQMVNGGLWVKSITAPLCFSFLATLFPCSSWASLPWDTLLHELLQSGSFPQATVLQELVQHESPMGCNFCQEPAPACALHRLHLPSWHVHLLWCAVLHGWRGDNLLHPGLHRWQGNFCSSSPSFSGPAEQFLSHFFLTPPYHTLLLSIFSVS